MAAVSISALASFFAGELKSINQGENQSNFKLAELFEYSPVHDCTQNKKVAHTFLPSFENANSHLPQERLLRSRLYFWAKGVRCAKSHLKTLDPLRILGN